jgi:tetratricopeptide (TPR) repeat protein
MRSVSLKDVEQQLQLGNFAEAEALAHQLKVDPLTKLAVVASIATKQGEHQRAEVLFQRVLSKHPNHGLAQANYAKLLISQKKFKAALPYAERAFKSAPSEEHLALAYVQCLADADRFSDAVGVLQPFVAKDKPTLGAYVSLSSVYRANLDPLAALDTLTRAMEFYADDVELQRALADVYAELDPELASEKFDELEGKTDNPQLTWNRSFVELRLEKFEVAWDHYEAGLTEKIGKIGRPLPAQLKGLPMVTDFADLDAEKWTLFSAEQGLGDQVLFLSCMGEALNEVSKAAYIGEERLLPIMRRSFPSIECFPYAFALNLEKQLHRLNGVFPTGSLPKHFRRTTSAFKNSKFPYLRPNQELVEQYRAKIKAQVGDRRLIGISWRGGFWERQRRTKSFELALFSELMKHSDTYFICLQYGDISQEKVYRKEKNLPMFFVDGIDFKKDIDSWFALICACDGLISVSTAAVHFAAAAGKPVDLILGDGQSPFVWGTREGQSLVYPSVLIHRKHKDECAEEYFTRIARSAQCLSTVN